MNIETPLKRARLAMQLTQHEAAELVRIDQGQWSRIERGQQQPRAEVLFRIVDRFAVSEGEVLSPFRRAAA